MTSIASTSALKLEGVSKVFGTRKALDEVSFELPEGAFLSIFGHNGAGKTTLLRAIATLARPTSGTIEIAGVNAKEHPDEARESIGFISHEPMLYNDLTPEENLILYGRLYGVADPEKRAVELLDDVGLKQRRKDRVRTFSRGMIQRASIARALVNDPSLLLLDEPYAGLDPHGVGILDRLLESHCSGRTLIMVSHDLEKGFSMCTHALILSKGRVVAFGEKTSFDQSEFFELCRSTFSKGAK